MSGFQYTFELHLSEFSKMMRVLLSTDAILSPELEEFLKENEHIIDDTVRNIKFMFNVCCTIVYSYTIRNRFLFRYVSITCY